MEATHNHHGILSEERMIERVHGIDRHKSFSTISVLNRQGARCFVVDPRK
jgi:hypothetical protein